MFTGEERVAVRANLNVDIAGGGTRLGDVAAGAGNRCVFEFRMDCWLHKFPSKKTFITYGLSCFNRRMFGRSGPGRGATGKALDRSTASE